jgi:hypothetical protein
MPFASYSSAADVARAHHILIRSEPFVEPLPTTLSPAFRDELTFTLTEVPTSSSEPSACETLIYPLLREVWKPWRHTLTLWSHEPIHYDADLTGTPDYMVARRSPYGPFVTDMPYLLVVEAKRDDYLRGWGQCLAALVACQKINKVPGQTLYGMTTNGRAWEMGRLTGSAFTTDTRPFSLADLDTLAAAVNYLMAQCHAQVVANPLPSAG